MTLPAEKRPMGGTRGRGRGRAGAGRGDGPGGRGGARGQGPVGRGEGFASNRGVFTSAVTCVPEEHLDKATLLTACGPA